MAWLTNWNRRKQITVNGSSAGAQSDYQMKLTVNQTGGADSAGIVNLGGNVLSSFNDLRFTKSDGVTLLNYWIESVTGTSPNQTAIVWIKLAPSPDTIPASPGAYNFYIYYDNASASVGSNVSNTFIRIIDGASPVVGAWKFDNDNTSDFSGRGNNATKYGGVTVTTGKFGDAYNFNGTDAYLQTSINGFSASQGTILLWIKPNTDIRYIDIGLFDTKPGQVSALRIYTSQYWQPNKLCFETGGTPGSPGAWPIPSNWQGQWHLIGLGWSGNTTYLYVDGVQVSSASNSYAPGITTFQMGRYNNVIYFNGAEDEPRVYTRLLSSAELTDLFNNYGYVTTNYAGRELVRKYTSLEPTWGTVSNEQNSIININSTPTGAEVWLAPHGQSLVDQGIQTNTTIGVAGGYYDLKLTLGGYQDYIISNYNFSSLQTFNIQATMSLIPGSLSMSSTPSGAEIYINTVDQLATTVPSGTIISNLPPGTYNILLRLAGYQDWTGTATVTSNTTTPVSATLIGSLITATNMLLDKTTCLGSCTVTATITWNNPGPNASFEPAIKVDGTRTGSGSTIIMISGQIYTLAFSIPLGVGGHSICPDPN